jgi:lipopolysaccharide export system ATP-binding protein
MKSCVKAVHLGKSYGRKKVLDDVSVEIQEGEIVGLLGPNGAGKTTTFSLILGLVPQDSGRVFLDDEDITDDPMYLRARKGIGLLPQEPSVFRRLTVEENLLAVLETQPGGRPQKSAAVARALAEVGLERLSRVKAFTLSGGERRRLEVARALVPEPKFMLLDEPFTGIDPITIQELQKIVHSLKDKGLGVLVTDHNVRETLKIVDRAYIIDRGRILKEGEPAEIIKAEEVKRSYLGDAFRL